MTPSRRPRRRRRPGALRSAASGSALLVAACGSALLVAACGSTGEDATQTRAGTKTVPVTRQDLADTDTFDGTLGFGDATTVIAGRDGTLTSLAAEGTAVDRGGVLFAIDTEPTFLLLGPVPAYRTMRSGDEGADVRQLQENLKALGYDKGDDVDVDGEFDGATRSAVKRWQDARDADETGRIEVGDVVFEPTAVRVGTHQAEVGAQVRAGAAVTQVTSATPEVTVKLDTDQQRYAKAGTAASVELPDAGKSPGTVTDIGKVAKTEGSEADARTYVEVTVSLSDPAAAGDLDQAPVEVTLTKDVRKGVLTVPVNALVALAEGGYALEVDTGRSRKLVGVDTGLFSDGRVEVAGDGIRAGTKVVVPG